MSVSLRLIDFSTEKECVTEYEGGPWQGEDCVIEEGLGLYF